MDTGQKVADGSGRRSEGGCRQLSAAVGGGRQPEGGGRRPEGGGRRRTAADGGRQTAVRGRLTAADGGHQVQYDMGTNHVLRHVQVIKVTRITDVTLFSYSRLIGYVLTNEISCTDA